MDLVRRAVPHLKASPVYQLVRAHVAALCEGHYDTELGPEKAMLRVATIELVRALIFTAVRDERGQREVLRETLYLRVVKYLDQHLAEPELNAEHRLRSQRLGQDSVPARLGRQPGPAWPVDHRRAPGGREGSAQLRESGDDDRGRRPAVAASRTPLTSPGDSAAPLACRRASGNGSSGCRSTLALL